MPILLALLGVLAGAYFWMNRARDAANMVDELAGAAQNALGAARRFCFRKQAKKHPADCIEDASLAVGGLGVAFMELGGTPTQEQQQDLLVGLQSALGIGLGEAEELAIVGHWFVQECKGPQPALTRLAKRLFKISGPAGLDPAMNAIGRLTGGSSGRANQRQQEALSEIERIFRAR